MDGTDSKVFIDKTIYPFPPEQANIVFFMDNFLIQNTETKKFLETSPISHEEFDQMSTPVSFEENGDLIVQALQIPPNLSADTQYVSIKYGNSIAFNILCNFLHLLKINVFSLLSEFYEIQYL